MNLDLCSWRGRHKILSLKTETSKQKCVCVLYEYRHVWSFIWKIKIFMSLAVAENRIIC